MGTPDWFQANITLSSDVRHFVVESYRRGSSPEEDQGDAVVDDMRLDVGRCPNEGWLDGGGGGTVTGSGTGGIIFFTLFINIHKFF